MSASCLACPFMFAEACNSLFDKITGLSSVTLASLLQ